MRTRAVQVPGALLAALGLTLGASSPLQGRTAPAGKPVEVTYYYLPG